MGEVFVRGDGCIQLGPKVTCDGFSPGTPIRVQTHVHHDHLKDLDRSKGQQQKLVCTRATYDLLCAEYDADLPFRRSQWVILPADGKYRSVLSVEIALHPSGHMIGSTIVTVRYADGKHYTYTSDFSWPLRILPDRPDVLVVDATYGDPANIKSYDEDQVIREFLDFSRERRAHGSILLTGYRGRLQYALQLLAREIAAPFLVSRHVYDTLNVYMQYQSFSADVHVLGSAAARSILQSGEHFMCFVETRDRTDLLSMRANVETSVLLSAFMVPREMPLITLSNGLTRIALTDHADFSGTIELVKAISPCSVVTDGTRGGNADVLADFIRIRTWYTC